MTMLNRIEVARGAQQEWAMLPVHERVKRLKSLRRAVAALIDPFVAVISEEVGKPPLDALTGDVMVTLEHLRYCEHHAEKLLRPRKVGKPFLLYHDTEFEELMEPHGVVLVLAPWNYPLQLAMVPMTTALFAGNAVVMKCSERTPMTAALIREVCEAASLPEGLVQVCCDPPEVACAWVEAKPDMIFFTGSSANGKAIARRAAELFIPVTLELGGKDASVVFASSHLQRTVEAVVYGAFSNAGQVCVGIKRVYVQREIHDAFVQALCLRAQQLRTGTSLESDMGPVRFPSVRSLLAEQIDDALARGATLHTPWNRTTDTVPPLILTDVPRAARLLTEETFGPVLCIQIFEDETEAIALANDSDFALSASVFTQDQAQSQRIARALAAGSCAINDAVRNIGNPYAAFGGNRASGHGRYHGGSGFHAFSRIKTVMKLKHLKPIERHWFPFTAKTFQQLKGILQFRHSPLPLWKRLKYLPRSR